MTAPQFNILALDGGGLKGVYSAAILAAIEEDYGTSIIDHVDMIAGASTGGILALGLAYGLSPAELLQIYCDNATSIFPRRPVRFVARECENRAAARIPRDRTLDDRANCAA